jgi:hypothetical protein
MASAQASQAARSKAARLRKLAREKKINARERAWLDAYERERKAVIKKTESASTRKSARVPSPSEPQAVSAPVRSELPANEPTTTIEVPRAQELASSESASSASSAPAATVAPDSAPSAVHVPSVHDVAPSEPSPAPDHLVPIARFDEPPSSAAPTSSASTSASAVRCPCGGDCPGCKGAVGSAICATTGKRYWPRMSAKDARGFAAGILTAIGWIMRYVRPDRRLIMPTEAEVEELAAALVEILYRYVNVATVAAPFSGAGYTILKFGARAAMEPEATK